MKLAGGFRIILREHFRLGRIGEMYLISKASTLGGQTLPRKNCEANMSGNGEIDLVGVFLLFLLDDYGLGNQLAEVEHSKALQRFPDERESTFLECKCSSPRVYFRSRKEVSIPQRMA